MRRPPRRLGIGEAMLAVAAVALLLASMRAVRPDGIVLAILGPLTLHRACAQWRIDRAAGRSRSPGRLAAIGLTSLGLAILLVVTASVVGWVAALAAMFFAIVVSGLDLPAEVDFRSPMRLAGVVWFVVTLAVAWRLGPALWPRVDESGREERFPRRGRRAPC